MILLSNMVIQWVKEKNKCTAKRPALKTLLAIHKECGTQKRNKLPEPPREERPCANGSGIIRGEILLNSDSFDEVNFK